MNVSNRRLAFWLGAISIIVVGVLVVLSGSFADPVTTSATLTKVITTDDWTKGNPDAAIQIVEYSDFQCPACQYYYPIIERIVREFESYVSFTYRHFPLRAIHPNADMAAQASEAAGQQGKFWEMYDLIFANQATWADQDAATARLTFTRYAAKLELDVELFQETIDSSTVKAAVDADFESGLDAGVNSTPSIFMNGVKFEGNPSVEEFRSLIRAQLETTTK